MSNLLSFSDGVIKLDNKALQGILGSLRVKVALRFDNQEIDGLSGKKKVPIGWADADISFSCVLLTDEQSTCYEKLKALNSVFRTKGENGAKIFDVDNKHLTARGIRQVVFSDMESAEDNASDEITVTLAFTEYEQPITKSETAAPAAVNSSSPAPDKAEPTAEASIMVDIK